MVHAETQISDILAAIPSVTYTPDLHPFILRLSTSVLLAADLPLWTSHGRKLLEYAQQYPQLYLALLSSLAELNWGGWKLFGLPAVLRRTSELLESEQRATLRLLVNLQAVGKLKGADHVWKVRMGKWVEARLASWTMSENEVSSSPRVHRQARR